MPATDGEEASNVSGGDSPLDTLLSQLEWFHMRTDVSEHTNVRNNYFAVSRTFFVPQRETMLLASHATAGGHRYDPANGSITLGADATPYALAHERAHQAQHAYRTIAWRVHESMVSVPYLCRLGRLWLEWEAARLAIRALELCEECDHHARAEARAGRWSYIRALFWA